MVFGVPVVTFYGTVSSTTTLEVFGMVVMSCLILTMQYRVFFLTSTWNFVSWLFWVGSYVLYIMFIATYSNLVFLSYRSFKAANLMMANPLFWVVLVCVPGCAMMLDVFVEYLRREFFPNPIDISLELQRLEPVRAGGVCVGEEMGECVSE